MVKIILRAFALIIIFSSMVNAQTDILKDPRDGKEYKTVRIGGQTWMAENIKYLSPEKYSKNYTPPEGDSNYVKYGWHYDWKNAMKICPVGWHLPSKEDFEILLQTVGNGDREKAYHALIPGGSSGFNALMGGTNTYIGEGFVGAFWSSTEHKGGAIPLYVSKYHKAAFVSGSPLKFRDVAKNNLLSVRCIKD
jgi:uncharacterized protein (TIGR02145 family)